MCNAPQTCGDACAQASPAERMSVLARHVQSEVSNDQALEFFTQLGSMPPEGRAEALSEAAREAGVGDCALARVMSR